MGQAFFINSHFFMQAAWYSWPQLFTVPISSLFLYSSCELRLSNMQKNQIHLLGGDSWKPMKHQHRFYFQLKILYFAQNFRTRMLLRPHRISGLRDKVIHRENNQLTEVVQLALRSSSKGETNCFSRKKKCNPYIFYTVFY